MRPSTPTPHPSPRAYKTARVEPSAAFYSTDLSEVLLPYEAVRSAADPAGELPRVPRLDLRRGRGARRSGIAPSWRGSEYEEGQSMSERPAPTSATIEKLLPSKAYECEACVKIGSDWVPCARARRAA
jgi:hypothetical protein